MLTKRLTQLIIAGASISTVTLGYYLFSRRSKLPASDMDEHVSEIANWADRRGENAIAKSVDQVQQFQHSVHEHVRHHLPDLYKATERIPLSR